MRCCRKLRPAVRDCNRAGMRRRRCFWHYLGDVCGDAAEARFGDWPAIHPDVARDLATGEPYGQGI